MNSPKHPFWIRWTHWVNFPLLAVMIWSGVMIYWANDVYWPTLSAGFYETLHLDHRLADGMALHFFFMWFFAFNGLLYFCYLVFSGQWKFLIPGLAPTPKFNRVQALTYFFILLMGFGSILTGLVIYKPVQLAYFKNAIGGYEAARFIHYLLTVGFILFFFVHVTQVIRAGWNNFQSMVTGAEKSRLVQPQRSRTSFATLLGGLGLFAIGLSLLLTRDPVDGIPGPLRAALEFNEKIATYFLNPEKTDKPPKTSKRGDRVNGDLGLEKSIDIKNWKMQVVTPLGTGRQDHPLEIKMEDLRALPKTTILTQFKCIEGWSENMVFAGVKFSDFLKHYHLGTHSGKDPEFEKNRQDLYAHVGLETPDGQYYVSVDMKSMLGTQTLLAYEMNGFSLTADHGAPLRLIIPNKYGVKSLKRIGKITFSDEKLPDYWGEQGYDWFIGL